MKKRILTGMLILLTVFMQCGRAAGQDKIQDMLQEMSLEQKVAQMFLVRCPASGALSTIEEYQPGGYILFADHFNDETKESISRTISSWQDASAVPMLIGVDEEGGTVTRVSRYKAFRASKFESPRALFARGGIPLIVEDAREKSELLLSLGVNFNLCPVADISTAKGDFMYSRSLGEDAETTALYAACVVKAMNGCGIASAVKHFPGYGNNRDTHGGMAVDKRPYESFMQEDFVPFQAAVSAGAGCILVSHNIVSCMDADHPASLSAEVHRVLRENLGFDGVIMTDDLSMGAVTEYTEKGSAAVQAVKAGNDLLCCTSFVSQYQAVLKAVQDGTISEERIDESVRRILEWKVETGIIKD